MKSHTKTSLLISSSLALIFGLVVWFPVQTQSAEPKKVTSTPEATMREGCEQMMKKKKKMMADMQAQDTELTSQLAKLNSVPEDKKLDLLSGIVTQLVEQRGKRNTRKAEMKEDMMKHMMVHMQMGKESMSECPMMKGMHEESTTNAKEAHTELK